MIPSLHAALLLAALAQPAQAINPQFRPVRVRAAAPLSMVGAPFTLPLQGERRLSFRREQRVISRGRFTLAIRTSLVRASAGPAQTPPPQDEGLKRIFDIGKDVPQPVQPAPVVRRARRVTLPERDLLDEIGVTSRR